MPNKNINIGNDLIGVGNVKEGGVVNQNIHISQKDKIPSQLSSKLGKSTIIGRKKELKKIDSLLKTNNSLLLINGIGGVGKSTIASYYLHSKKEEFDYYGFFEGLEGFISELKSSLKIKEEIGRDIFLDILSKLRELKGNKLLVIDDVKNIEENQNYIDRILELKHNGYKILITSREEIEGDIYQYYLDVLSKEDAKALFNSIYKVEDEKLLEEILEYLDYHAFFIEKTAHSIKKTLTPEMIRDKFKSGEFSKINVKRKQNFNKFLNQLFTLDNLDNEEILMLKQLSALPSIEIPFEFLETIFQKKGDSEFEELLDFLSEKGWLSKLERGYKLHQIIKEYIILNYPPTFEEIEIIVDSFISFTNYASDPQIALYNRNNIIYFESLSNLLDRLKIENEKVGDFFSHFGDIYHDLGLHQKAEPLYLKVVKIFEKVLGEEHPNTAISYNNLAGIYRAQQEYKKAEYYYQKALKINEKIHGEEHNNTATCYHNLALLYKTQKKYKQAKPLYEKALKINKKIFGEEDTNTATSYNNLAGLYEAQGEHQKAERFFLKALEIRKKVLGENHYDTAISYNSLGIFYFNQKNYKEAYPYAEKANKILSKILPLNNPYLINAKEGLKLIESKLKTKTPIKTEKKIARNSPCPCGSGKKYKKCCGR